MVGRKQKNKSSDALPIVGHLLELRRRLLWCVLAFVLGCIAVYPFTRNIFSFLVKPLATLLDDPGRRLIYTGLPEAFVTYLKVMLFSGFLVSSPFIAYQVWQFVAPGLYQKEKKVFFGFLFSTPVLFMMGAAFAFYGIIPMAWAFFLSYESAGGLTALPIQLEARVSEYLSMTLQMLVAFGICFQLPIIVLLCARMELITGEMLAQKRRYAVVLILIVSAILTPPDVLSMLCLATPIYLLYELSIFLVKLRNQKTKDV
jgi:sec-independent protein translocase protein TatC